MVKHYLKLDQLFVNGVRQHMARYPDYDPSKTDVAYRGSAADAIAPTSASAALAAPGCRCMAGRS